MVKKVKEIDLDLDEWARVSRERQEMEEKELGKISKPIYELVFEERFTVTDVLNESYSTSLTPRSEVFYGGHSPSYSTGDKSILTLQVNPSNVKIPVRELEFHGFSSLKAGDLILAKIPRYEEKKVARGLFGMSRYEKEHVYFVDRGYNPLEKAIELSLVSDKGKVLRRERAVDYLRFVK